MSSIRLFILSSFDQLGPMHGHRLRIEAERRHVHFWTDITVGAVYGAMKRLEAEGLLREAGQEQVGNRPQRQLYEITEAGRLALKELRREGLSEIWFKYDPFDLALTRTDRNELDRLPSVLAARLAKVQALLDERRRHNEDVSSHFSLAKEWALRHSIYRLEAELAYLTDLLNVVDDIVADEQKPRPHEELDED
jgi:DNA-binding PadR family transcriptional regulator